MGSIEPPCFDGRMENYDKWETEWAAFAEEEGLCGALGDCRDTNMPDSSVVVVGKDAAGKLQAAAVKTNKRAMAYLALAFDTMRLLRLIIKAKSEEWPEGEAWKVMQFLRKKYCPDRVGLRKMIVKEEDEEECEEEAEAPEAECKEEAEYKVEAAEERKADEEEGDFKEEEAEKNGQWVVGAKRSGRVPKGNEQWNMNPDVQRQLKGKMPESTITQWESVRGCVNRIKGNRAYDDGNQAYDRAYVGNRAYDDGQRAYDDGQSGNQAYDRAYGGNHAYDRAYDGNNAEENEIVI